MPLLSSIYVDALNGVGFPRFPGLVHLGSEFGVHAQSEADIVSDVMWVVELEPEVKEWLEQLSPTEFAAVLPHVERLAQRGNQLRMPASKPLGAGLFELRFDMARATWRIPFFFASNRRIVLLTVFRKQRMNERQEIDRARSAMERCIADRHTAEEDDR